MARITKKIVDGLRAGNSDRFVWDAQLRGFGVRTKPSGVKSFVIQYRNSNGRSRRYTIGQYGRLTVDKARKEAQRLLSETSLGGDPAEDKHRKLDTPSFREFAQIYFEQYAPGRKKESSIKTDEINLRNHLLPKLGRRALTDINKTDVRRIQQSLKDRPGAANRSIALLSNMLNVAENLGFRTENTNPCRGIESLKLKNRERYLTLDEFRRLNAALTHAEQERTEAKEVIAAIRLLIYTGCRKSEILSLKWGFVSVPDRLIRMPTSKTGAKTVYLNEPALNVLKSLDTTESEWVLPGADPTKHIVNLRKPWTRLREAASLEDVRIHDLRHTFASVAVSGGESLPMIGKMLGHSQSKTTQKYAHLDDNPVRAAAERVGKTINQAMNA